MLAPIVARPMASVLGRPLARAFSISGKLGRENSMRSPRRTAQTSSALMVGPGTRVHHRGVRRLAVQIGDEQRRQRDQRRLHHHQLRQRRRRRHSAIRWRRPPPACPGGQRRLHRLQRGVRVPTLARDPDRGLDRPPLRHHHPADGVRSRAHRPWPTGQLLIDTTTANTDHLSVGSVVPGEIRRDRELDDADRRDLQTERAARQLPRR